MFRSLVFGVAFIIAATTTGFSVFGVLGFCLVAGIIYFAPLFRSESHVVSFFTLTLLSVILGAQLRGTGELLPFALAVSALAYLILATKELHFIGRTGWHYVLTFGVWYLLALTFFSADHSQGFSAELMAASITSFLLWREFFHALSWHGSKGEPSLAAALITLAAAQLFWLISTLPLTMINSTNLAALVIFSITDLFHVYGTGSITTRKILWHITTATLITIAIFFVAV